jgi:hypothetical protein
MQNNYNNRDFEQFVQQNADQYRMFPSEKVWRGIHSSLHTRRRWYGLGLGLLLLFTASTVTWVMLNPTDSNQTGSLIPSVLPVQQSQPSNDIASINKNELVRKPAARSPLFTGETDDQNTQLITTSDPAVVAITPAEDLITDVDPESVSVIVNHIDPVTRMPELNMQGTTLTNQEFITSVRDEDAPVILPTPKTETAVSRKPEIYPHTIESVLNNFQRNRSRRVSYQLYFTPTISYRKLSENKSYIRSSPYQQSVANSIAPYNYLASMTDVNNVVTHKPDLGLELGASAGFQASKDIKLKAGLQFNISRYDIKAFTYSGENATIALNSGNDIVSVATNLRNSSGYKTNWLQNLYFSVSVPLGVEYKLGESGKTSINIGGSVQPTYILSDQSYLISSDYKNYAMVPWLMRKFNLNTSFETFVTVDGDKLKWQVGPQVRYQMLSSFKQKYPVRENLFDFGVKVGIQFNR